MAEQTDFSQIKKRFPMLKQEDAPAYLDNAATTQKPEAVISRIQRFYEQEYATVHRGVYQASQIATDLFEAARADVAGFFGADSADIVFTRGTTEAINMIAAAYGEENLKAGDIVLISELEHHSNIVPWQILRDDIGIQLKVMPVDDRGDLIKDTAFAMIAEGAALIALTHVSNAIGTLMPVKEITEAAHDAGALVLIDGAQAAAHVPVNVKELGCDFYTFSGHKMYGPTGIGGAYISSRVQPLLKPYQTGGGMIERVTFNKTTFASFPAFLEAGTPAIAEAVGLSESVRFLKNISMNQVHEYEQDLLNYVLPQLKKIRGLTLIGEPESRESVISFAIEGAHPHDIGSVLDHEGVWVRAGHHCAQPAMDRFGVPATTRASFGIYNNRHDADRLVSALEKAVRILI